VAGYSGDAGNALVAAASAYHIANGMKFSTPDRDNDEHTGGSCAMNNKNGWWFRRCAVSSINNVNKGIWTTGSVVWNVKASRMLVKLN